MTQKELSTFDGAVYVRNDGSFIFAHPYGEPFEITSDEVDKLIEFLKDNKH